ncbi:MAG: flagellar hook-basal body complex protein, partial [Sphingopyxis sp.]
MSYYTSLSGLRGAQADLSAISNNVANVGTYGFKRSRVEFGDIMPPSPLSAGLGVRVRGVNQQFTQGGVEASTRDLDIAINGAGFFMSRSAADDGRTVFTRDGSLGFNADRYLTDSNNGFVQVLPVDSSGRVTSTNISSAQSLQLPETSGVPRPTTVLEMTTTLPRTTDKPAERSHYSASNPYAFNRADPFSYNFTQSTTVYDDAGTALPATLYFTAVESTLDGDSADRWEVHAFVGDTDALATPMSMTFNPAGALISPSGAFSLDTVLPTGATAPLNMDV